MRYLQHGGGSLARSASFALDVSDPNGNAMTLMRNVESVYFQSMTKEDEKNKIMREKLHAEDQLRRLCDDKDKLAAQLSIALVRHGALLRPRTLNTLVTACARAGERAGDLKTGDLAIARELVALADDPSTRVRPYSNATLTRLLVAQRRVSARLAPARSGHTISSAPRPNHMAHATAAGQQTRQTEGGVRPSTALRPSACTCV